VLSNEVGILLCIALLVLWLGVRREDRLVRERACRHEWRLESLYDEGRVWYRRCERCGKQLPIPGPDDFGRSGLPRPRSRNDRPRERR
jgi:hypothetical protein